MLTCPLTINDWLDDKPVEPEPLLPLPAHPDPAPTAPALLARGARPGGLHFNKRKAWDMASLQDEANKADHQAALRRHEHEMEVYRAQHMRITEANRVRQIALEKHFRVCWLLCFIAERFSST
jgi:hypothetical protein